MRRKVVPVIAFLAVVTMHLGPSSYAGTALGLNASYGYVGSETSHVIVRGDTAPIGVSVQNGVAGTDYAVELWARPYARSWRKVADATVGSSGRVVVNHAPVYTTIYQWRYTVPEPDVLSNFVTVRVRTKVTLSLADTTLRRGQTLVAVGRTFPAKPGAAVALWWKRPTRLVKLAAGTVRSDGTYRLTAGTASISSSSLLVYTTVAASSGNLKGTSPYRSASVS